MTGLKNDTLHLPKQLGSKGDHAVIRATSLRLERVLLALWLVINLGIGAIAVHEYGMSIDEPNNYRYAADTLSAYPSFFGMRYEPNYDSSYDGHGPAFVTIAGLLVQMVQIVFPDTFAPDLWHYLYFVTFQLTGLCLYWLSKRWFSTWTAWGLLILFGTQPVLLGHAFINPKDIPFMFFLTLSILLGLRMVDSLNVKESFTALGRPARHLTRKFRETEPRHRRRFLTTLSLALAALLALAVFSRQINSLVEQTVTFFYTAEADTWAGQIFHSVANPASDLPIEDYVNKALRLVQRTERGLVIAGMLFLLAYFALLITGTTPSGFLRNVWTQRHKVRASGESWRASLQLGSARSWVREIFRTLRNRRVIFAGLALGLATGVRAIGPLAGAIVVLDLVTRVRTRAWTTAIAYFLVAGITTYISWPRLWDSPIWRYLEGLGIVSNFPHFPGRVLFNGEFYGPGDLPRSYLPVLLNIQFTEPAILCIYIGLAILAWRLLRDRVRTDMLLYIGLAFVLPLFALIGLRTPLYHNFRQVLFLIPAMFMLAAFTLELAFHRLSQTWLRVLLIAAIGMPGVYSTAKLHPYEYVYYNSFVGGPAGAVDRYELDYWRISLREMALELNELAPSGSLIVVTRSAGLFARYARPDLVVDKTVNSTLDLSSGYDYLVQVARWEKWDLYPEVENLILIERDGVVLATAKDVRNVSGQ